MGCFNHTCGVTRQSIYSDEEVYLVFIADTICHDPTYACYINEHYTPVSFPIRCNYDEYGRFFPVPEHEALAEQILKHIRKNLIEDIEDRSGRNRDHDVTRELTWEEMMDCIHDGRIKLSNPHAFKYSTLSNFPIKKEIFEGIMGWTIPNWRNDITRESAGVAIRDKVKAAIAGPYVYSEAEQAKYDATYQKGLKDIEMSDEDRKEMAHEMVMIMREFSDDFGDRSPFEHIGVDMYGASLKLNNMFRSLIKRVTNNKAISDTDAEIIERMIDIRVLGMAMTELNIQWFPPMLGGQDDTSNVHIKFAELQIKSATKDENRWCECEPDEPNPEDQVCEYCWDKGKRPEGYVEPDE